MRRQPESTATPEKITFTVLTGSLMRRTVPREEPRSVAMIITGSHCQWIGAIEPMVKAPTAFQSVATKIMEWRMEDFRSSRNTPTMTSVAKRPAPEEREPEKSPTRKMSAAPVMFLSRERSPGTGSPKPFLKKV